VGGFVQLRTAILGKFDERMDRADRNATQECPGDVPSLETERMIPLGCEPRIGTTEEEGEK
jgi:hypothetical protein